MAYPPEYRELFQVITHEAKREKALELPIDLIKLITNRFPSPEEFQAMEEIPFAYDLRAMWYQRVIDWQSKGEVSIWSQIEDFIGDPTFVDFPEMFAEGGLIEQAKVELMNPHPHHTGQSPYREGFEILGGRPSKDGHGVEVMVLNDQYVMASDGLGSHSPLRMSSLRYDIPKVPQIGYLLREFDGILSLSKMKHASNGTNFIGLTSPYSGYGDRFHEVIIPTDWKPIEEILY